jgi:hypothetical protein
MRGAAVPDRSLCSRMEVGRTRCRIDAGAEKRREHFRIQSNRKAALALSCRFSQRDPNMCPFRSKCSRGMLIEPELTIANGCSANSLDGAATLVQL